MDGILKTVQSKFTGTMVKNWEKNSAAEVSSARAGDLFGTAQFGIEDMLDFQDGAELEGQYDKEIDFEQMSMKLDDAFRKLEHLGLQAQTVTEPTETNTSVEGKSLLPHEVESSHIHELVTKKSWAEAATQMLEERDQIRKFVEQMASLLGNSCSQSISPPAESPKSSSLAVPSGGLQED